MKIKILFASVFVGTLLSCNSNHDPAFCDCLKAGDELNNHSKKLLTEDVTPTMAQKQQELLKTKKDKCKNYQIMSGPEMQKRKEACGGN